LYDVLEKSKFDDLAIELNHELLGCSGALTTLINF